MTTAAAVREASPDALTIDEAMKAAMNGTPAPAEAPPPPDVDRDAPHGRDEDGTPLAPYGYRKDGIPKKAPQGRPQKTDQARTAPPAQLPEKAEQKKGPAKPGAAYGPSLDEFGDALWMGGSVLATVGPKLPLVGKYVPAQRVGAASHVFKRHKPRLVAAMCVAADHSQRARRLAERIDTGDATWAVIVGMLVLPCVQELALVMRGDNALAEANYPALAELAEENEKNLNDYMQKLGAMMREQADALAAQMDAAEGEGQ